MHLLESTRVCGQAWEVWSAGTGETPSGMLADDLGYTDVDAARIYLREGLGLDVWLDTYIHEKVHAVLAVSGLGAWLSDVTGCGANDAKAERLEETFVRLITPWIVQMFRASDNFFPSPDLLVSRYL